MPAFETVMFEVLWPFDQRMVGKTPPPTVSTVEPPPQITLFPEMTG